jgi:hypothetical protein
MRNKGIGHKKYYKRRPLAEFEIYGTFFSSIPDGIPPTDSRQQKASKTCKNRGLLFRGF